MRSLTIDESEKKCRTKRGVKQCTDCCRYDECYNGFEVEWKLQTMLKLGNAIVESIGDDYCKYWKLGCRGKYLFTKNLLRSNYIERITANQTDGVALEEKLARACEEKYGSFDNCHKARKEKYTKLIAEQERKLKETKNVHLRKRIRDKIYRLKGDMYL